ncbi:iron ABC transporter permease [Bacillus cereus group sp. N21]|uniref:FecCD family ABC transporter permease n=1 Tax=Bacillus cereus group sp. N21 TaxID=2794591 RepID=UPI0018F598F2|nr:iron ABC transporter permease [Bacillus cereus group sp. N21]MBJ8027401.1 iron ABC transporter permease [Bacillus cereus group sp. N21]
MHKEQIGSKREIYPYASSVFKFILFFLLLIVIASISILFRVKGLTLSNLYEVFSADTKNLIYYTVWNVRVPRVLLAILIGAALAVAGCLLQGITRNPLSDPEIMGVNQGASCFVVLALLIFGDKDASFVILIAAFLGAAVGSSVIYSLAFRGEYTPSRLVLAGIAVSFFLGSVTTGSILLYETQLNEILYWMAGKLSGANWLDIKLIMITAGPVIIMTFLLANQLNILSLGEETARGLGINVLRIRRIFALIIVLLVGSGVAVAGPIGFVGLMVPHIARKIVGEDYRIIIPFSALLGANLLVFADFVAQRVAYPADTPVGVITALLGTPFFVYLMRRKRGAVR